MTLLASIKGHMLIKWYKEMVKERYCEPTEIIMGCFTEKNTATVDINVCVRQAKKKKKDKTSLVEKGCKDIRKLLSQIMIILFS